MHWLRRAAVKTFAGRFSLDAPWPSKELAEVGARFGRAHVEAAAAANLEGGAGGVKAPVARAVGFTESAPLIIVIRSGACVPKWKLPGAMTPTVAPDRCA